MPWYSDEPRFTRNPQLPRNQKGGQAGAPKWRHATLRLFWERCAPYRTKLGTSGRRRSPYPDPFSGPNIVSPIIYICCLFARFHIRVYAYGIFRNSVLFPNLSMGIPVGTPEERSPRESRSNPSWCRFAYFQPNLGSDLRRERRSRRQK
jgi:hypothetical protein